MGVISPLLPAVDLLGVDVDARGDATGAVDPDRLRVHGERPDRVPAARALEVEGLGHTHPIRAPGDRRSALVNQHSVERRRRVG